MKKLKMDSDRFKISFIESLKEVEFKKENKCTKVTIRGLVFPPTLGNGDYLIMEPFQVVGVGYAKPNAEDKYKKSIGIKVATAKAEQMAYIKAMKEIEKKLVEIKQFVKSSKSFEEKVWKILEHNSEYIMRIS